MICQIINLVYTFFLITTYGYVLQKYRNRNHQGVLPQHGPEYVNGDVVNPRGTQLGSCAIAGAGASISPNSNEGARSHANGTTSTTGSHRDPFDMSNTLD